MATLDVRVESLDKDRVADLKTSMRQNELTRSILEGIAKRHKTTVGTLLGEGDIASFNRYALFNEDGKLKSAFDIIGGLTPPQFSYGLFPLPVSAGRVEVIVTGQYIGSYDVEKGRMDRALLEKRCGKLDPTSMFPFFYVGEALNNFVQEEVSKQEATVEEVERYAGDMANGAQNVRDNLQQELRDRDPNEELPQLDPIRMGIREIQVPLSGVSRILHEEGNHSAVEGAYNHCGEQLYNLKTRFGGKLQAEEADFIHLSQLAVCVMLGYDVLRGWFNKDPDAFLKEFGERYRILERVGPEDYEEAGMAAMMHDMGRLVIPDRERDDPELREKNHTMIGAGIMDSLSLPCSDLVRYHHAIGERNHYPSLFRGVKERVFHPEKVKPWSDEMFIAGELISYYEFLLETLAVTYIDQLKEGGLRVYDARVKQAGWDSANTRLTSRVLNHATKTCKTPILLQMIELTGVLPVGYEDYLKAVVTREGEISVVGPTGRTYARIDVKSPERVQTLNLSPGRNYR